MLSILNLRVGELFDDAVKNVTTSDDQICSDAVKNATSIADIKKENDLY